MPHTATRRGFALPAALAAIVILGLVIAGVYYSTSTGIRTSRDVLDTQRAFRVAEQGLNRARANFDKRLRDSVTTLAIGATLDPTSTVGKLYVYDTLDLNGRDSVRNTVRITRLATWVFLLTSTATVNVKSVPQTAQTSALLRLTPPPTFNFMAALTARGPVQIGGSSYINGYDGPPTGWNDCPPNQGDKPGVAVSPGTQISFSGCNNLKCINGSPDTVRVAAAGDTANYFNYNGMTWADLVKLASGAGGKTYDAASMPQNGFAPVVTNGVCNQASNTNWGDYKRNAVTPGPCESYFPVIYIKGATATAKLTGGSGQGILLVEGDLEISGGFEFYGPVIIRGHLKTTGTGGHLNGGVMAADVDLEQNVILGNAIVNYSSCAITKAIENSAASGTVQNVTQRPWMETY